MRALRELLRYAPAPRDLLANLDSSDANLRQNTLLALSDSREPIPARYVLQLAGDRDPKMRAWSIQLGFSKQRTDFGQFQPELAKLLYDPDIHVRLSATKNFASIKDPICVPPLLSLLKDTYRTEDGGEFFTLTRLADYVANQKFGFDSGTEPLPMKE